MAKFLPDKKPHLLVFYLKFFEAWMVVFGPNQLRSRFVFCLNFKFKSGPHVILLSSLSAAHAPLQRSASAAYCHCLLPLHAALEHPGASMTVRCVPLQRSVTATCRDRARAYRELKCASASSWYSPLAHATARPQFLSPLSQKKPRLLRCHCHRAQSSAAPSLCCTRAAT
jgi:hypothetical protein